MTTLTLPQHTASPWRSLAPLTVDVAVPTAVYFGLRHLAGAGVVTALIVSSIVPVVRSVWAAVREHRINGLAALMLAVNIAGIALSFVSGDVRVILAKDSGISSVIAIGILVSAIRGRSVMSAGLAPFVTRGDEKRVEAWERLAAGNARFRSLERRYGIIWGVALLLDCVVRVVGAFTLPISVVAGWFTTTVLIGTIVLAVIVSGGAAADPMTKLVDAEVE